MPVSFSSIVTRSRRIGSSMWMRNGPTSTTLGSRGARRDAWNACWTPSRTIENPQSMMPRFGYRAAPMPK
jgi:hypothetical protein